MSIHKQKGSHVGLNHTLRILTLFMAVLIAGPGTGSAKEGPSEPGPSPEMDPFIDEDVIKKGAETWNFQVPVELNSVLDPGPGYEYTVSAGIYEGNHVLGSDKAAIPYDGNGNYSGTLDLTASTNKPVLPGPNYSYQVSLSVRKGVPGNTIAHGIFYAKTEEDHDKAYSAVPGTPLVKHLSGELPGLPANSHGEPGEIYTRTLQMTGYLNGGPTLFAGIDSPATTKGPAAQRVNPDLWDAMEEGEDEAESLMDEKASVRKSVKKRELSKKAAAVEREASSLDLAAKKHMKAKKKAKKSRVLRERAEAERSDSETSTRDIPH